MALIKIQRFFGAVPNDLLNNPDISFKAKGLYAYLNSKPDNWDFSVEGISAQVKEGIDSVRAGIHELEKFNYLKRIKHQNEKGFWEVDYMLFESPMEVESYLGKSNEGKHPKQYKKENTKKYNNPSLSPLEENEELDFMGLKEAVELWLKYKAEKKQMYKSSMSIGTMIKKLHKYSGGDPEIAMQIIEESISNNYQGFFELKYVKPKPISATPEETGDAKMMAFFERGYKSCTKDELKWIYEWQHRAPAVHLKYPNNVRLVRADSPLSKQDAIDADRAAGY
jgi:hypothetical protein